MDDIRRGKIYGALFAFFIVLLIVGGYKATKKLTENEPKKETKTEEKEEKIDLRIDKEKDVIYFENEEVMSEKQEIVYQNAIINLNSDDALSITSNLNNKMSELKKTIKIISGQELDEEELDEIIYKEDDIYSATYEIYTRYFYRNYASLLVDEYDFDCKVGSTYKISTAYVFNTKTGKLLSKKEILNEYKKDIEDIKLTIKEKLESKEEEIDVTETLKLLDNEENYALYVNKSGYLCISYLVKTAEKSYNDIIILN